MDSTPGPFGDLRGKIAVVTGASHGVGAGIARELARQGAQVVVNGRDTTAIDEAVDAITARRQAAIGAPADVTDEEQVRHCGSGPKTLSGRSASSWPALAARATRSRSRSHPGRMDAGLP